MIPGKGTTQATGVSDRAVHAESGGLQIVRYSRAGKWRRERSDGYGSSIYLTLAEAVNQAASWGRGAIKFRVPGGSAFDRRVLHVLGGGSRG